MPAKSIKSKALVSCLKQVYPDATCELNYETPFQLLIATVLSAQCTDKRVNIVTQVLFRKYPDAARLSKCTIKTLEALVRSTGFYRNKAKNILATSKILVQEYDEKVPQTLEALTQLPGVGRKTANVVLNNAFHIPSGVVVDTHVSRLSKRFGWTTSKNPEHIEQTLQKIIPKKDWIILSHLLIAHGRNHCKAQNPKCRSCPLESICPQIDVPKK